MELLKCYTLKPEQSVNMMEFTQMESSYKVPVNSGDNGILLIAYAEGTGSHIYVGEGDGVFAGDEKSIPLQGNKYTVTYLESGPFMIHEGENKGHIRLYSDDSTVFAAVILLK